MSKHTEFGVEESFFDKPTDASRLKHRVVTDYFSSYTNVLARNRDVGYADLFAGPGIYRNGEKSIPILITERVIADERLRRHVRLWFNEADPELFRELKKNVLAAPGVTSLAHKPAVTNKVVGVQLSSHQYTIPTLVFADPCGYKGLSLDMIAAALKGFGNDCVFFFNYRRVNMKLSFPLMDESINQFFSAEVAEDLRRRIASMKPRAREAAVLDAIKGSIRDAGGIPLVFRFKSSEGGGTSHHLVFASKQAKGANIMKRIMNKCSSQVFDGVGSFEFDPREGETSNLPLFSPITDLADRLLEVFAGQTLTFDELLEREAAVTQYTDTNYRDAVLQLESEFRIEVDPRASDRRMQGGGVKRTLPGGTLLKFSN
jgi:three-Cys-motif partner protein